MLAFVAILFRKKGREKDIGKTSVAILFRKEGDRTRDVHNLAAKFASNHS